MGCRGVVHLFEWRVDAVPAPVVDRREIVWAGMVEPAAVPRRDRDLLLRRYLRRFAPELLDPAAMQQPTSTGRGEPSAAESL